MNKSNLNRVVVFLLAVFPLVFLNLYAESESENYKLVTDVLDGSGGASQSDNYSIPSNSGGQPSPVGTSESDNFMVRAGYSYASYVKHGDANADGQISLSDVVYLINYVFKGGDAPVPLEAGDVNCDGDVNITDVVYLINYLFKGGDPPC